MRMHKIQLPTAYLLLWIICLCLTSIDLYSQTKCSNRLLTDIHAQLAEKYIQVNVVGEISVPELCKSRPVIIEESSNGVVNHIGIKLFDRKLTASHPSKIYHFVERYLLELLLMSKNQDIVTKMKMERVRISSQVHSMVSVKEGIRNICSDFTSTLSFSIICRNNRYIFSCMDNHKELLNMSFPVRYELIEGYTKLELESAFYPNLLMFREFDYVPLSDSELFIYKDSLYSYNEDYYLTEDFVSTSYYKKVNEKVIPVLDSEMLSESVCNLFNTDYDWGVEVEITQSMYGEKNRSYTLPLFKFTRFLHHHNCMIFTGIQKYDKSFIEGGVMAVNMELGYQHLMVFSFPKELVDNPREHKVKVKMYGFIPIHNISSFFDNQSKIK